MQCIFFRSGGAVGSRRVRRTIPVLLVLFGVSGVAEYAMSHSSGESGVTNKAGGNSGCSCHCSSANSATTVTISTAATTFQTGQSYTFTISVSNSNEAKAGCDIAVKRGTLAAGTGLKKISSELTHSSPKTLPASWTFTYTAPTTAGTDTIFAAGNAVNGDGGTGSGCSDKWNFASKFIITVTDPNSKTLTYSRLSVALGNVRVGASASDTMYLRNTGNATVSISSRSMKTGTDFSNTPNASATIASGSTELQTITFSPKSKGALHDSLVFRSDASTAYQALYVSGTGIQAAFSGDVTSPVNTIDFSKVPLGASKTLTYAFQNTGDDTLFLSSSSLTGAVTGMFSIVTQPAKAIPPGGSSSIDIRFTPPAHQTYGATLVMNAANGVSVPQIALTGSGAAPAIYVTDTVNIGTARVGIAKTATITVSNTGDTALHVKSATIQPGQQAARFAIDGTAPQTIASNTSGLISVKYTPTSEQGDTATLALASDDPTVPTKTVMIIGHGIAPHMSLATNDTIDFGDVGVGSTAMSSAISIGNTGEYGLVISSITVTPAVFTVVGAPTSIGPDSSDTFTLSFRPTTPGVVSGRVIVRSDDVLNNSDTLFVVGNGIKANIQMPSKIDFGTQLVASQNDTSIVIRNAGNAPIAITSFSLTDVSRVFTLTDTVTHTIAASDSAVIGLRFTPLAMSSYSGSMTFVTDEATGNKHTIALAGAGMIDNAVVVSGVSATTISIWPNPASLTASLRIASAGDLQNVRVEFFDALGRTMSSQAIGDCSAGSHSFALQLPGVSGIALVRVIAGSVTVGSARILIAR